MNTAALAEATAWLSERLPHAQLSDLAAMLELGLAVEPAPPSMLSEKLGMPPDWVDGFIERHLHYHGGLAPLIELDSESEGACVQLSQIGHNLLNQFWQRASGETASTPA